MASEIAPATTATAMDIEDDGEGENMEAPSLIIPITSSVTNQQGLFVEIFPEELNKLSVPTLIQVLRDEDADLGVWADASLMFMQQKHQRESLTLLEEACDLPIIDKNQRVRVLACTGIATLAAAQQNQMSGGAAKRSAGTDPKAETHQQADQKFTQASKVEQVFPMTWIGRGMLDLSRGQLEQARSLFQLTSEQCGPVMPALLGMAAVLFRGGDYKGAQQKYAEAIRNFPTKSGPSARVGFGLACYKLGQVDRAKASFTRALRMDPECVEAMVGAAILDMAGLDDTAKDFSSRTEKAIKMLSMANLHDPNNAMVQNHLANHYFWKWTPVTGTVDVSQGSKIVKGSQQIPLDPGEQIRIGNRFETTVKEDAALEDDENTTSFRINDAWKDPTAGGLKVWKKDYDRVIALAKGAYSSTSVQEIQAESLFFLARVYHVREDNDNAHKFYERACKLAPELTPARFGLAQTLIVKEQYKQAAEHLKTVLAASSSATDALALLGLIEVKFGKNLEGGLTHLRKAVESDPLNPDLIVLEAIALHQNEINFPTALEKYKKAIDLMKRKGIKVPYEILANSGVLCHETKKYDEALNMYKLALTALDDGNSTAQKATLENVGVDGGLIRHPDNDMFYNFVDSTIKVEPTGEDKTVLKITDPVKTTDLSSLLVANGDHIRLGAGDGFVSEIVSLYTKDGSVVVKMKEAYDHMNDSNEEKENPISLFVKRENSLLEIPEATTIAFNLARLHEKTGHTLAAIELHKAILKRNPGYVNGYLRLACIAVDCGSLKECSEWLKLAAKTAPGNPEVLTLIGNLHLSLCDWKPAQDVFDALMAKKIASVEAYSALSLGNIYFANLSVSPERYSKHLKYASDYYKRILSKDPANAYAANGLGTVLAEKGDIFKAKEVFNRVREVSGDNIADALLNLGHIFLAQKKHSEALQMYQSYMKRAEDGSNPVTSKSRIDDVVDVLLYIAFAYFDWARHTEVSNDANAAPADGRYKHAMEHLELAISKHSKKDVILKYNLAMTKLQAANCVLQKLTRNIPRTVEEVAFALNGLEVSLKVVEEILKAKTEGHKVNIPTSTLQDYVKHCKANIASAKSHLEDEKKRFAEVEAEREIRKLATEAAQKEEALKQALQLEEVAKKQEERDQKAQRKMLQVQQLQAGWKQEQEQKEAEKERKKRERKGGAGTDDIHLEVEEGDHGLTTSQGLFADDSSDDDIADDQRERPTRKLADSKKQADKTSQKDLFGDSDDSSDDEQFSSQPAVKGGKSAKDLFGDSDDDDNDDNKSAPPPAPDKSAEEKKADTQKDLFGDSDDEDSDEELIRPDAKRAADAKEDSQPSKKRKVLEDDEDD